MSSLIQQILQGKLWDFPGGIHPAENKNQSNQKPITPALIPSTLVLPVKQHIGRAGEICVKVGDFVKKGQVLTQASTAFMVPIHAPTSGTIIAIEPRTIAHPSGLSDLCIIIEPDRLDLWGDKKSYPDYHTQSPETLIEHIRQSGIAGLGGAAFPTARKLQTGVGTTEFLIINAAECEPYITADDRLMQDYAQEIMEGVQILQHILKPKLTIIAVEDNKPEAINALCKIEDTDDIIIRAIPTKYPSGASKQLIQILTGKEVPAKAHSASIGVIMQNIATAFAIKRAVIDGEPLVERVVTITGNAVTKKSNRFALLGTPLDEILTLHGYKLDSNQKSKAQPRLIMGGALMGFSLPHTQIPITKITNCIIAPSTKELPQPSQEMACIRCSECAVACPIDLLPQQLFWYAKSEDYAKVQEYHLSDCMECGACAYVCPSNIPLVQYYRQAKAQIKERNQDEKNAERARLRFEQKQARLEKEKKAREERFAKVAKERRQKMETEGSHDAIAAAIARVKSQKEAAKSNTTDADSPTALAIAKAKAKQAQKQASSPVLQQEMIAQREARKEQARTYKAQVANHKSTEQAVIEPNDKKAAVAAAIARAKARKAQANQPEASKQATNAPTSNNQTTAVQNTVQATVEPNDKKAAVAAAIARAKARKAQANPPKTSEQATNAPTSSNQTTAVQNTAQATVEPNDKKAAVAAAIARAKARKAQANQAKASEQATNAPASNNQTTAVQNTAQATIEPSDKKAAVAAAIARAKARKAQANPPKASEQATQPSKQTKESIAPDSPSNKEGL